MRDVIWTIIAIWVIYKLVDIFRSSGTRNSGAGQQKSYTQASPSTGSVHPKRDIKEAIHKSADKEGEYIDFEEVK